MPWCPKCRAEYREGFDICHDCNVLLVSELPNEPKVSFIYDREIFLLQVADEMEADIVGSLLQSYEIPVLRKYKEAGGYLQIYMGLTNFGIDLYVPSSRLRKAQEIISTNNEVQGDERDRVKNGSIDNSGVEYQRKKHIRAWIIFLFIIPGFLLICVEMILALLHHVFK